MTRRALVAVLALLLPAVASAQQWEDYDYENLEFRGIGVDVGYIWPSTIEPTAQAGLRADLGFIGPRVRVSPALRFWSSSLDEDEIARLGDQIRRLCERQAGSGCPSFDLGDIRRSDLELSVDGQYLIPTGYTLEPYLGAGGSLHLLNGSGEAISGTFVEDLLDTLVPGLNLLAGVNLPVGALQLVAEARFVISTDIRSMGVLIGGTWALPSPGSNPFTARRERNR